MFETHLEDRRPSGLRVRTFGTGRRLLCFGNSLNWRAWSSLLASPSTVDVLQVLQEVVSGLYALSHVIFTLSLSLQEVVIVEVYATRQVSTETKL